MSAKLPRMCLALGCCAVLAGCTQVQQGTSTPSASGAPSVPSSGPGTSESSAGDGAPKVAHPVDVSRFKSDPCALLTSGQLKTLGLIDKPTQQSVSKFGKQGTLCQWPATAGATGASVGLLPNSRGLGAIYGLAANHEIDVFAPVAEINGFPAVKAIPKNLTSRDCTYVVGLNDQDAVNVDVSGVVGGDSCKAVLQVARDVTITVKGES